MYLIEWTGMPSKPATVLNEQVSTGQTLEEAMAEAHRLFASVHQMNPQIVGFRICKEGPPPLFEWCSPEAQTNT